LLNKLLENKMEQLLVGMWFEKSLKERGTRPCVGWRGGFFFVFLPCPINIRNSPHFPLLTLYKIKNYFN